jgi:hypothetical protein
MGRIMVAAGRYARTGSKNFVNFVAIFAMVMLTLLLKSYWIAPESKRWMPKRRVRRRPF